MNEEDLKDLLRDTETLVDRWQRAWEETKDFGVGAVATMMLTTLGCVHGNQYVRLLTAAGRLAKDCKQELVLRN